MVLRGWRVRRKGGLAVEDAESTCNQSGSESFTFANPDGCWVEGPGA